MRILYGPYIYTVKSHIISNTRQLAQLTYVPWQLWR
jgi:hypothetical protein